MTRLTREAIDYYALAESVRDPHCGAIALFLGTVSRLTGEQVTVFLDYEAYGPMAEKKLAEIEDEVRQPLARWERRDDPPARPARGRRCERRGRGELPASGRGVRRVQLRGRYTQGTRADLEEGKRPGRNRRVGSPVRETWSDMNPPTVFLARHGETEWSKTGRHTGRTDLPLTVQGEADGRKLRERLGGMSFARVFSSPLGRARRTAELAGIRSRNRAGFDGMELRHVRRKNQR